MLDSGRIVGLTHMRSITGAVNICVCVCVCVKKNWTYAYAVNVTGAERRGLVGDLRVCFFSKRRRGRSMCVMRGFEFSPPPLSVGVLVRGLWFAFFWSGSAVEKFVFYIVMANGIRTGDPRGFNKGRSSKFREGSRVRRTPEEGRRTYRPKRCGNNNKDEDNSPKNLNDKDLALNNLQVLIGYKTQHYPQFSLGEEYLYLVVTPCVDIAGSYVSLAHPEIEWTSPLCDEGRK